MNADQFKAKKRSWDVARRAITGALLWALTIIPTSRVCAAQQELSPSSQSGSHKPSTSATDNPNKPNTPVEAERVEPTPSDHAAIASGRTNFLTNQLSEMRWGYIFLHSVDVMQAFSQFRGGFGGANDRNVAMTLFQATVIFDKSFKHNRLAFQYRPRVAIVAGRTQTNFGNHDVQFDTFLSHTFNPRWSMNLDESLDYHGTGTLYADSYFSIDPLSGGAIQNSFLEGPTKAFSSSTTLTFIHPLSQRTNFSFGPRFAYARALGGYQQNIPLASQTFGALADLDHALSPTRNIGLSYSFQRQLISRAFASGSYHSLAVNYSQQLAPSWRIGFSLGATVSNFLGSIQVSPNAAFTMSKAFQRSSLAISYTRSRTYTSYITNGDTQRANLNYSVTLTPRLGIGFETGYERSASTLLATAAPRVGVSGSYGTARMSYQLTSTLSWFASYVYRKQVSKDLQVFPGTRNFALTGLTWTPRTRPGD